MKPAITWPLLVSLGAVLLLGAVDVWLYLGGGPAATITHEVRRAAHEHPVVPLLVGFAAGLLLAHLFWSD